MLEPNRFDPGKTREIVGRLWPFGLDGWDFTMGITDTPKHALDWTRWWANAMLLLQAAEKRAATP